MQNIDTAFFLLVKDQSDTKFINQKENEVIIEPSLLDLGTYQIYLYAFDI